MDDYHVGQSLGTGSYATVTNAVHKTSGREVAIKWPINVSLTDQTSYGGDGRPGSAEAAALSLVSGHKNIVHLLGIGYSSGGRVPGQQSRETQKTQKTQKQNEDDVNNVAQKRKNSLLFDKDGRAIVVVEQKRVSFLTSKATSTPLSSATAMETTKTTKTTKTTDDQQKKLFRDARLGSITCWLALERLGGGHLLDEIEATNAITKNGRLGLGETARTKRLFGQLVSAIAHAHSLGVVHRDLKLENLMLTQRGGTELRVCDWNLSSCYKVSHQQKYSTQHHSRTNFVSGNPDCRPCHDYTSFPQMRNGLEKKENDDDAQTFAWHLVPKTCTIYCGSVHYSSPEIVGQKPYRGPEIDCWSMGVCLYTMVSGLMPFYGKTNGDVADMINEGRYPLRPEFSNELRQLLRTMLDLNPDTRATAVQVLQSQWLNGFT